jgi:hypothetical protein
LILEVCQEQKKAPTPLTPLSKPPLSNVLLKMAPRGPGRRPGRQRRRPGSFRDDPDNFHKGNHHRSSHSLKPREERPYQEFHPDLDTKAKLLVISSTEPSPPQRIHIDPPSRPSSVLPQKRKAERPLTPVRSSSRHSVGKNGSSGLLNGQETPHTNGVNGIHATPNGVSAESHVGTPDTSIQDVTATLSIPVNDRSPLQILRHNFAASLPMSRAETNITITQEPEFEAIAPFKNTPYIGRSMADVGYQESEYWSRPTDSYIRFYGTSLPYSSNSRNN